MKRTVALMLPILFSVGVVFGQTEISKTVTVSWGAVGWIALQVHEDIFLGVVDESYFDPETQAFQPLESFENQIIVACNFPGGCTLTLEAVDWQVPAAFPGSVPEDFLVDFLWRLSGGTYQALGTEPALVWSSDGPTVTQLLVDYRYELDVNDVPGEYAVTLLYTASAP